jgi:hypothetical protein
MPVGGAKHAVSVIFKDIEPYADWRPKTTSKYTCNARSISAAIKNTSDHGNR